MTGTPPAAPASAGRNRFADSSRPSRVGIRISSLVSTVGRGYGRRHRAVGYRRGVTSTDRSYDAIVVGLGGIGSAAAYRLAAAPGRRILGLERFELGHDRGASQDVSRITRLSYHRREYVELAIRAQAAWREVEAAAGEQVITITGGLDLAPPGAAESIDDYATAMTDAGVRFEWLDATDVARRWPQWRLDPGTRAIFQEAGGIADAERGNAAHQRLARAAGATLLERTKVAAILDHAGELEVITAAGQTFTAGAVVLATDAWTNELLAPLGHSLPLSVTREQVTWFAVRDPEAYAPGRFPAWIWIDLPSFYGVPTWRGPGPKVGADIGGRPTTADGRDFETDRDYLARVEGFLAARLPGIGPAASTKTCLYTVTPDRDFVIDRVPGHPGIVLALGAAHAYKFAALFGVLLADLALDASRQPPRQDLALFAAGRPVAARACDESRGRGARPRRIALRAGRHRANLAGHRVIGPQSGHGPTPGNAAEEDHMRSSIAAGSRQRLAAPARALLAATLLVAPTLAMAGGARAADDLDPQGRHGPEARDAEPVALGHGRRLRDVPGPVRAPRRLRQRPPAHAGVRRPLGESADKMTHTFHIREGMKWSDGEPATCEDARYSYQLVLDAAPTEVGWLGSGYLDTYLTNAGLKSVACSSGGSLVATTEFPTTLLLQAYVPILPKHIWSKYTLDQIGNDTAEGFFVNEPVIVGSGPYVAVEWKPGEFIRMARNPNYWGKPGVPKEIIYQQFSGSDTLVSALKAGDIDYVRGTGADQFDALKTEPDIALSEGFANGYTYLSMNTRGNTGGYNASTSALADQKFRDAIGYAIDRQELVDKVLNGHGVPGTTHVPPYHVKWHVEPANPRTFNIAEANSRLDAAGYPRNADNKRVDKDGKVITLRLTWPDSEDHSADAQFIAGWFEQIGIGVEAFVTEENTLYEDLAGPESGGEADWDFYMWGWTGDPDPMSLLSFFTTDQIEAAINDPFYSNARYDELFKLQQRAIDEATRKTYIAEMQQLFYDAAAYHILYNDSELHAYRKDKFAGWVNQPPDTGTPLFGYGYSGYMALTDASAVPTPGPTVAATAGPSGAAATPAPTQAPGGTDAGGTRRPS